MERLLLNPEVLDSIPIWAFRQAVTWCVENILDNNVLTVENWLEVSFHLCKQRWDSSVDWLETQPMSKVMTMIDIVKRHNERQEDEAKKASRRRK